MDGVTIGSYTWGQPRIHKWTNKYTLTIGKFCSIADDVDIIVDGNHRVDWVAMYPFSRILMNDFRENGHPEGKVDMRIGNDVWIGMGVVVVPGVNIGDGAVISAGAVVTHDVLPYTIVGGVPARYIRDRFPYSQFSDLMLIKWWDWDIEKIKEAVPMLESGDVNGFIRKYKDWNLIKK